MPECSHCQGKGTIPPATSFGMPMKCYRCSGTGAINWDSLRPGDHVCYLYDDPAEQLLNISKFLAEGLPLGERIIYVFDHHTPVEIDAALTAQGVDVVKEHGRGALCYLSKEQSYLLGGSFDPEAVISGWRTLLKKTLRDGFSGIRGAAEASWALHDPEHCNQLINYELMCDLFFLSEQPRITGVCQYDRTRFSETTLKGAEVSHRLVFQD